MRPALPPLPALLALAALLVFGTGCVQRTHRASGNHVAIALTVNGTEQPNAEQWANVVAALKPELAAQGMVLVNDLADADRILRIDFTPDFTAPNSAGQAVFLGWRINPLRAPTFAAARRTSISHVNYSSGLPAYYNSPYGYDRYSDFGYGYGGGGGSASVTPHTTPPTTPPDKAVPPGKPRDDCPPGTNPPHRHGPGRFVGVDPDPHPRPGRGHHPDRPPVPPPRYPTSSDGSSANSSSGGSSSYSSSAGSSSHSSSSSSFSSGGSSSVSSGGGVAGGSHSSSSYSPGSSGTHESPTQRQN